MSDSSAGSSLVQCSDVSDPGYCLCEFCMIPSASPRPSFKSLAGPGVQPEVRARCGPTLSVVNTAPVTLGEPTLSVVNTAPVTLGDPTLSVMHTAPFTLASSTIASTPPPSPNPSLTNLTGALFQLPEVLPLSITPYYVGEADSLTRWVHRDEAVYKEIIDAIADECFVYLYDGILYNMPAVPAEFGPYFCVTRGRYIGVFNHWNEVAESIKGFADVVYAVTSLTVGEILLHTAIKKGEVHKCRV